MTGTHDLLLRRLNECATIALQPFCYAIASKVLRGFVDAETRTLDHLINMLLDCATTALQPLFKPIKSLFENYFQHATTRTREPAVSSYLSALPLCYIREDPRLR